MDKFCVIVLAIACVHAKVVIKDVDVSNVLTDDTTKISIKLEDNINGDVHATDPSTCHNELDVDNTIDSGETHPCEPVLKVDNGTALILTPFIEEGRIEDARNASRVDRSKFLGFESYSGFLTVDKKYNSNIFFWYFPALKPTNDTPWMIWLQGGPGASSMTGLFDEIGPFRVLPSGHLVPNPYTWLTNHSLVFIDNPVGTGYSYTEHQDGLVADMDTYAKHLHSVTKQLVQIFPELRVAPLYVAGESYAGKYVPALGAQIHRHKDAPGGDINLQGLIIGNAYVEPSMITEVVRPFYHFGLLEREQIELMQPLVDAFKDDIANNRSVEAKNKWSTLVVVLLTLSSQKHAYNFLRDELAVGHYQHYLQKSEIKRAIHVGDIKFSSVNISVNTALAPEFLTSARPMFEELLEHYRVLAYCGQLDQMLPCAFTSESYRQWKWSQSSAFLQANRAPCLLKRRLAGYIKSGGGLTWAVIRGAGHMVPMDTPLPIQQLVAHWTHSQPLTPSHGINPDLLMEMVQNSTLVYL